MHVSYQKLDSIDIALNAINLMKNKKPTLLLHGSPSDYITIHLITSASMKQRLTGMLVYAKHGLLQLLQQLLSPHQHHQQCPSQSVNHGCFACVKTITETCEQIIPKEATTLCRIPNLKNSFGWCLLHESQIKQNS
jgi:hypothetical protein